MALTRKFLTALGIDAEKIDEIINAHSETVDALKQERDSYKADAEKLPGVQKELDALKVGGYQKKYEDEHAAFEKFKTETANEKALAAKKSAYEAVCKDAGLSEKGVAKALKYADWSSIEIDDDGKVKDAKNHIKELKEEWAEHIVNENVSGAKTTNPPANNGGGKLTKADIFKKENGRYVMSTAERQKALAENPDLLR